MHALHARLPKNFVLEERLERYARAIELEPARWRGRWAEACFPAIGAPSLDTPSRTYHEVRLDLGCGKGSFIVESARREPDVLFIGMDSEPVCIAYAAQLCCESGLHNVVLIPGDGRHIEDFFGAGELARIHLNFPTPFPRKRDANRRMACMERLMDFRSVITQDGAVELRTDSQPLFDFFLTQVPLAGYTLSWQSRNARAERPHEVASEYEQKLSAQGATVHTAVVIPGPAPSNPVQTAELSLAQYLPDTLNDLAALTYIPHGMQATVENLCNQTKRQERIQQRLRKGKLHTSDKQ